jgi:hypothetical protein
MCTRMREPDFCSVPRKTLDTRKLSATRLMSSGCDSPKTDALATTRNGRSFDSIVVSSSVRPPASAASLGSELRLASGKTATDA